MNDTQQSAMRDGPAIDDSTFSLLADARRRAVLRCLCTADESVGVTELARDVVASERDVDAGDVSEEAVERVSASLHHGHLPKLDDEGYLRYDYDRTIVVLSVDWDSIESILDWTAQLTE